MEVKVISGQSLLDIAVQEFGTLEAALALSVKNDIPVTAELTVGQEVQYGADISNDKIADYLKLRNIKPATAATAEDNANAPHKGIGHMIIERSFIIR